MAFEEVEFPDFLAYGSQGGPGHSTQVVRTDSGHEQRISKWSVPLRQWDVSYAVQTLDALDALRDFVIGLGGAAVGFRFKDFNDFSTTADGRDATAVTQADQELGAGDGSKVAFQLVKQYVAGTITRTRSLQKIKSGTVLVEVDGVLKTEGVDYSVNYNTGIITFNTAPGSGLLVKAGCEFFVPVRFGQGIDQVLSPVRSSFDVNELNSIDLVEIRDGLLSNEVQHMGGARIISTAVDIRITPQEGRVQRITPTAANVTVTIPTAASLPEGGPYFVLENPSGSSFVFNVEDENAIGIATHAVGEVFTYYIGRDNANVPTWMAL